MGLDQAGAKGPVAVYSLPPGHLRYGGESMALAILQGLRPYMRTLLLAPEGPVHLRAAEFGIPSRVAPASARSFTASLAGILRSEHSVAFMSASVEHSLLAGLLNKLFRRQFALIHLAHGGPEPEAYRRKKLLNRLPTRFVAVSEYARQRLEHYGVDPGRIVVIGNFLDPQRSERLLALERPQPGALRRILTLGQLQALKRPGLILDAIETTPELGRFEFRIVGDGPLMPELSERAERLPNVSLPGFRSDIEHELEQADLLLHACPVESFGLVVLEAMTAGVPVLVPDAGGAGDLVQDGLNGYRFAADSPHDLAATLLRLSERDYAELQRTADHAQTEAAERYNQQRQCARYYELIDELLSSPSSRAGFVRDLAATMEKGVGVMSSTLERAVQRLKRSASGRMWRIHSYLDRDWDSNHHVETSKIAAVGDLDIESSNKDFAVEDLIYVPTPTRAVHRAVEALDLPLEEFVFIDYGSGKGRAVLGATEYPFRRIEGVEFARDLHEVALANLASFRSSTMRCRDVVVKHGDAVEYDIPDGPCFFYMYNTFEPRVMRLVLRSIEQAYRANPRPMVMVYLYPQFKEVMDEFTFFEPRRARRSLGLPLPHGMSVYVTPETEALARKRRATAPSKVAS